MRFLFGSLGSFVLILSTAAGTSLAQTSTISEREFLEATNAKAYWATTARYPRRETRTYERPSDGKLAFSETQKTEFLSFDKYRVIRTFLSNGKSTTSQEIQIGEIRYCKDGQGKWEIYCPVPPPAAAMGPIAGAQYSLELGADTKIYQRIYQSTSEDKEKSKKISYTTTDKIVLNGDFSHRERSIITASLDTKEIVSRVTDKVEYGVKLDPIIAPIK